MKYLFPALILLIAFNDLDAKGSDTAYYRRPYYLGISAGYTGMINGIFAGSPRPVDNLAPRTSNLVYWGASYGIMWAFPFARRMELEMGLDGNYWEGWDSDITGVVRAPDNPTHIVGYNFNSHYTHMTTLSYRLQFSYEWLRRSKVALQSGVEWWVTLREKRRTINELGFEIITKAYIPVSRGNGAIQCGLIYGVTYSGTYAAVRVAFCLKGMRIYRHKPQKYYTRTYED